MLSPHVILRQMSIQGTWIPLCRGMTGGPALFKPFAPKPCLIKCNKLMGDPLDIAIQEVKEGNSSSFNQVIHAHQQGIFRLCFRLTGNAEDAKDLTQEVFIRALKGIKTFRGDSDIKTWLYRIAINAGSTWRRQNLGQTVSMEETGDLEDTKQPDPMLQKRISRAVESLPFKQRTVFVMHHYEGYKHEEIASITNRSLGSVKANYFQAVQKLKEKLQNLSGHGGDRDVSGAGAGNL